MAASLGLCLQQMAHGGQGATWSRSVPGAIAMVTGLPVPTLNGVWAYGQAAESKDLAMLLADVTETGVPYCIQGRSADRERLGALAAESGLSPESDIPLMVLDDASRLSEATALPGLDIRELSADEYDLHAEVAAAGFEAPIEIFLSLTQRLRDVVGVRIYVGSVDGVNVSTALSVRTPDGVVGVFNVATPPNHRRHGYGAAVTSRVVADATATGAPWAWLQSSERGLPVYEGLGFRTVEAWPCWVTT